MGTSKEMVKAELSLPADMLAEYEGFTADFSSDEVALPFVRVLQNGSKQLQSGEAVYIEGAKVGDLCHTGSNTVHDSLQIIPLRYEHMNLHWRKRDHGGGLLGQFAIGDPSTPRVQKVENERILVDDPTSVLEDTHQYVCRVFDGDDDMGLAIISCARSQLKYARRWNVQLQSKKINLGDRTIRAPMFSHVYPLSTVADKANINGMSVTWHSFKFGEGSLITIKEHVQESLELAKQVNVIEAFAQESEDESSSSTSDGDYQI